MDDMLKRIDVHHHIVPKEYVDRLAKKGVTKGLGVPLPHWNVQKALEIMDANEIATAIVSISAPGVYFDQDLQFAKELSRQTNEICARLIADYPQRFGAFATLPVPDIDAALEELQYAFNVLKLDGVILLTNYDGYYLGDPRFERLFAELNRRKAVVFIHPTTPPGMQASHLGLPEAMMDVCFDTTRTTFSLIVNGITKNYPDVRFILSHAGGTVPYIAARVGITASMLADLKGASAVIADGIGMVASAVPKLEEKMPGTLSYYLRFKKNVLPEGPDFFLKKFYYDTALSASPHAFASLQTLVESSHIIFGTDYVFATPAAVPATIQGIREYAGFTDRDRTVIERENSMDLFPRLKVLV
ncbi:amidohydrolase [Ktedonosporobacter rubrisoli]|uniref:Amidohydrolase n=1 Tax=Ktedonosporobacter rubrisoli TaxID=2509675 RepID=A0A4P6JKL7_KTERU|nr:amidohydrolase family protein [Ktedonosporobacter rubrisoli]QBD75603.1 amidohydrolase [Ktedonosporobacter rubrisoli]